MTEHDVLTELRPLIDPLVPGYEDRVALDASLQDDLDMDSLTVVDLIAAVERHLRVRVPDSELAGFVRVRDVASFVLAARQPRGA